MQKGLGLTPKIYWIELVPMLVLLVLVAIFLSITPNCIDKSSCVQYVVGDNYDLGKLSELELVDFTDVSENGKYSITLSETLSLDDKTNLEIGGSDQITPQHFLNDRTYVRDLCF